MSYVCATSLSHLNYEGLTMMFEISNLCGLCLNGLQDAVILAHCGHRFCRPCFLHWESTGSKVCPECHVKLKPADTYGIENKESDRMPPGARSLASVCAVQLPMQPCRPPHAGLVVLYHSRDDVTSTNYRDNLPCDLACYTDCLHGTHRFHYCDNCETSFHRPNFQESADYLRSGRQGGVATPLSSIMKNPLSRASLNLEAQEKHRVVMNLHEQLLGHALYCTQSACGHRNCGLMKKYIWPTPKPRRRHRAGTADFSSQSPAACTSISHATASAHPSSSSGVNTEIFTHTASLPVPPFAPIVKEEHRQPTAREIADRTAERVQQIEDCVGLSKGCRMCIRVSNVLCKHADVCGITMCHVPYCTNLKQLRAQHQRMQAML